MSSAHRFTRQIKRRFTLLNFDMSRLDTGYEDVKAIKCVRLGGREDRWLFQNDSRALTLLPFSCLSDDSCLEDGFFLHYSQNTEQSYE